MLSSHSKRPKIDALHHHTLRTMACRICASTSVRSFAGPQGRYLRCADCSAITRCLSEDEYRALEPSYDPGTFFEGVTDKDQLKRLLGVDRKVTALANYLRLSGVDLAKPIRFLDVGCGLGGYVFAAKEMGFDAMGIEPSEAHSKIARTIGQLKIIDGYFDPILLGGLKFNVIMLSHVIEHIYNPRPFIASLCECLTEDGVLVLVTPNSSSILANMTGKHWPMLKPADHVSMISKETFSAMGVKATVATSEYLWEFAATVASVVKTVAGNALNAEQRVVGAPKVEAWHPTLSMHTSIASQLLKIGFAIISIPFYLTATLLDRRACLIALIRR